MKLEIYFGGFESHRQFLLTIVFKFFFVVSEMTNVEISRRVLDNPIQAETIQFMPFR